MCSVLYPELLGLWAVNGKVSSYNVLVFRLKLHP